MSETYCTEKTKNFARGIDYQKLWLMLFFKRAVDRKYSFRLAAEMSLAAGFDDIVFRHKQNNQTTVDILIQVKHRKNNSEKICVSDLLTRSGEFSLAKHYAAFLKIQSNEEFKNTKKHFFLIINVDFDHENLASKGIIVKKVEAQNDFLKIGNGESYKLGGSKGNIAQYLKHNKDYINTKLDRENDQEVSDWEIESFLSQLVFVVNLPSDDELQKLIKCKISDNLAMRFRYYDDNIQFFNALFVKMSTWLKGKKGTFLTPEKGEEFFQKIEFGAKTLGETALGVEELKEDSVRIKNKLDKLIEETKNSNNNRQIQGPVCFNVKHPVKNFVGRKVKLKEIHEAFQSTADKEVEVSRIVVISGLGGVGKSELARKYARSQEEYYDSNIIWIDAETQKDLEGSFKGLAEELNRRLPQNAQISLKEKEPIACVVKDIYERFGKMKSLFIFDNVEKYKDIKELLPLSLSSKYEKPCILITSHDQKWKTRNEGDIKVICLGEFDEIEALEFVKNALKIQDDSQERKVEELTKELQYFPLALEQAVAYINNKSEELSRRKEFEISDYLKEHKKQAKKLLKEIEELIKERDSEGTARYTKTILTTWNITRDKIADDKKHGKQAIDILNIMAYLASDNINIEEIFAKLIADDEEQFWGAVELLHRYSMINLKEKVANIHRLVQMVTRFKLEKNEREEETLRKALELINSDNREKEEEDIIHIVSVWEYASKHGRLIDDFYFDSIYVRKVVYRKKNRKNKENNSLHLLVEHGSYKAIKAILKHIEKYHSSKLIDVVNAADNYTQTPLHMAAGNGKLAVVKYLVSKGADLTIKDKHGNTPLLSSVNSNSLDVIGYLIDKGADVNAKDEYNRTLLYSFIGSGLDTIKYLVKKGADINIRTTSGTTLLHIVASRGRLEVVEYLVKQGADIHAEANGAFFYRGTPLHMAAKSGNLKVVKYLVKKGSNMNSRTKDGMTLLHMAAEGGSLEVFKYLVEKGADVNAKNEDGSTPLHIFIPYGNLQIVKHLVTKGAYINAKDKSVFFYGTPLHMAALHGELNIVIYLIRKGVDINTKNKFQETPLHYAVRNERNLVAVEYFIIKGAKIDVIDENGNTPLHIPAIKGNAFTVQVLLKYGADVNAKNNDGDTPLHLTADRADRREADPAKILLEYNADVNAKNNDGNTLLHLATIEEKVNVVKLLLKYANTDVNAKNNEGMTPLDCATKNNHQKVAKLLLAHGTLVHS